MAPPLAESVVARPEAVPPRDGLPGGDQIAEVVGPLLAHTANSHDQPERGTRCVRLTRQLHVGLVEGVVLLAAVAAPAGGHHVLPLMRAAAAARDDVVDVFGRASAVLAGAVVTQEHPTPAQRGTPA